MKTAYFWIIFLFFTGLVLSYYLLPSNEEMALIHLKSHRYSKAEDFYLDEYNKGVCTPTGIYKLSILLEKKGDLNESIHIIKEYAEEHPKDTDVLKRLAELYYLNNQFDEYAQTLMQMNQHNVELEPDHLRSLKDYYCEKSSIKEQISILNKIIMSDHGDEDDYAELAAVYVKEKEFDKAASILKKRRLYFVDKSTIDMIIFELWVNSRLDHTKSEACVSVVADYLKKKKDLKLALDTLNLFREAYPKLAVQLVKLLQPLVENNINLETAVLLILWDHPDQKEAIQKKAEKLELLAKNNPLLQNFLFDVYTGNEDEDGLLRLIYSIPARKIEERKIIDLATLNTIRNKPILLEEIKRVLGATYLEKHPIRALALEIGTKQKDAREKLNCYMRTHSLARTDRLFLFKLASAAKFEKEALALGNDLPPYVAMQEEEILEIAQCYIQMKKADLLYPKIQSAMSTIGSNGEASIALLDIALHHSSSVVEWIKMQKKIKETTLKLFFELAVEKKEYSLAFFIAERLLQEYPSMLSESSYALAQVHVGEIENGVARLKPLYIKYPLSPQIQRDYFLALVIAAKEDKRYINDLSSYMEAKEKNEDISKSLLRDFGYVYIDLLRDFNKAKKIFFILANESPAEDNDVKTLLYLWGPYVSEKESYWIEKHAEEAVGDEELAYWLENLNFIGRYQSTIQIFQQRALSRLQSTRAYFAYLQALAYEKKNDELKDTVDILMPRLKDRKHLEELAMYAEIAEYAEASVWIWQQLAIAFADDPLVWQSLGKAWFDMRDYCSAFEALETFFFLGVNLDQKSNSKLYESVYEYAECFRKQRDFPLSERYYILSLRHIASVEEQSPRMKEIAALCYYQLYMNTKGLYAMKQFYEVSGKDADSAAIYLNMLMDNGYLPEKKL